MRLLIVTQAVDQNDPILGFFHDWLCEFGAQGEEVDVIAQRVGTHSLPATVQVHSLGKERGEDRVRQVLYFWRAVWNLRGRYEVVLVHMTPIWVVLGSPLWLLLRKPVHLWYEARGGGWPLRLATLVARKVFSASRGGAQTRKTVVTRHGIDTGTFKPVGPRGTFLLTVGRDAPSKRLDILYACAWELGQGLNVVSNLPRFAVVGLMQRAALFLHASETALDKALLEAMASGCPVLSCAAVAKELLPPECVATPETMAEKARALLALSSEERTALGERLRVIVERDHGLPRLIRRLRDEMGG